MEPYKIPREYDPEPNREEITWTEVPILAGYPQGSYPATRDDWDPNRNQIVGRSRSYTYEREVLNRTHQPATRRLAESLVVFL